MESLGVRHDWATSLYFFTFMHWRRKGQPTPVFLPGESQGQGSLVGCRLWGCTESDMTEATSSSSSSMMNTFGNKVGEETMTVFLSHSVQFSRSVMSNSLRPNESQHARPPCLSSNPGVHPNSCPSSLWCHPAISSSVVPSPLASNPSQHQGLFQWVNSSHEVAQVLEFQL